MRARILFMLAALTLAGVAIIILMQAWDISPPTSQQTEEMPLNSGSVDNLMNFMERNPQCLSSTNGCFVCGRNDEGTLQCSTAIIACIPKEPECSSE